MFKESQNTAVLVRDGQDVGPRGFAVLAPLVCHRISSGLHEHEEAVNDNIFALKTLNMADVLSLAEIPVVYELSTVAVVAAKGSLECVRASLVAPNRM